MALGTPVRRFLLGLGMVLVLALVANGLIGGIGQLSQATTTAQRAQSYAQIVLGALGVAVPVAIVGDWGVAGVIAGCWAVVVGITGGLAPVVWSGSSRLVGVISGVASLVVALGIVWLLRIGAARPAGAADPLP